MSSFKPVRPEPRAEVMAIDAYVPGKSARRRASPRSTSCRRTNRRSAPRRARSRRSAPTPDELAIYPDGSSRRLREAIGRALRPRRRARIVCGDGSDELSAPARRTPICGPGDEGLYSQYGFLEYPIAIRAAGGDAGRRAGDAATPPTSTRCSPSVTAADQDRLSRQSQQSDRHLSAVRGGQAPARRPAAATCCSCSTRPMPNMCARNDYAAGHRAGRRPAKTS